MNDFMSVTAFDLLPKKEQERLADLAARDLLSHPMRSRAFFKRCSYQFLSDLKKELDEVVAERQAVELDQEQDKILAEIQQLADKMGIPLEQALQGIELK